MGECSGCRHWNGGRRSRGECDRRQHLGVGSATDEQFGDQCEDYERQSTPRPRRSETMLELRARLRAEARRAERRRLLSRASILAHCKRLNIYDVQWLRGELAVVAGKKAREALEDRS